MIKSTSTEAPLELLDKTRLGHAIASHGYFNPNDDSDKRQSRIFDYIFRVLIAKHGFKVELKCSVKDLTNLAQNKGWQSDIYKYLQPRADREGEGLETLVVEFYVMLKPRLRIPICLKYKDTIFPCSGNRRMKTHYMALHEELGFELATDESLCDYLEITPPEGMSEKEVVSLVRKISTTSNDDTMAQSLAYSLKDREHDLRGQYELEWECSGIDKEQFREKAREYFEEQGWYPTEIVLGDLLNRVLKEKRGHLVDKQTQDETEAMYANFFPTEEWLSDPSAHYYCFSSGSSRFEKPFVPCLEAVHYFEGTDLPETRPTLNLLVTRAKKMTNVESIQKDENSVIEKLTKYNLCQVCAAANMPLVERLLFPVHVNHELDTDTAYIWSRSKKKFIQVLAK